MARGLKTTEMIDRRTRLILLVAATAACAGFMPLGAVGALFSPLIFDARGNLLNPLAWLGFLLMIGFWIVCIVAPFVAWVLWRRQREPQAWAAISAPLVWGLATVTVLQFVPG
ncbi:MAG TPA: hypothetical protein PLO65_02900 [Caulobacter sp.]|nr:hypothetical protein [Caulobacter sp.]